MIIEIFSHTPVWVWAILAVLIYRGIIASRDRDVPLPQMFIVPAIFLGLSLDGIGRSFGWHNSSVLTWLVGAIFGIGIAWFRFDPQRLRLRADGKTVFVRGSWIPMLLMLAIFSTKYVTGVSLAVQPTLAHQSSFVLGVCLLYGVFNGLFIAQLLRLLILRRPSIS